MPSKAFRLSCFHAFRLSVMSWRCTRVLFPPCKGHSVSMRVATALQAEDVQTRTAHAREVVSEQTHSNPDTPSGPTLFLVCRSAWMLALPEQAQRMAIAAARAAEPGVEAHQPQTCSVLTEPATMEPGKRSLQEGCPRTWIFHQQVLTVFECLGVHAQAVAETMMARDGKSPQLRLLVPTPLCGSIIGKGGATIRSFAEDSQAAITVSPQACTAPQPPAPGYLLLCRPECLLPGRPPRYGV